MNKYFSKVYRCKKCDRKTILLDTPKSGTHKQLRCPYCAVYRGAILEQIDLPPIVRRRIVTINERNKMDIALRNVNNIISDLRTELF